MQTEAARQCLPIRRSPVKTGPFPSRGYSVIITCLLGKYAQETHVGPGFHGFLLLRLARDRLLWRWVEIGRRRALDGSRLSIGGALIVGRGLGASAAHC